MEYIFGYALLLLSVGRKLCSVLKLQVSPSLSPSLRDRLSSREVDYTNFYSELSPLIFCWRCTCNAMQLGSVNFTLTEQRSNCYHLNYVQYSPWRRGVFRRRRWTCRAGACGGSSRPRPRGPTRGARGGATGQGQRATMPSHECSQVGVFQRDGKDTGVHNSHRKSFVQTLFIEWHPANNLSACNRLHLVALLRARCVFALCVVFQTCRNFPAFRFRTFLFRVRTNCQFHILSRILIFSHYYKF